MSFNEKQALSLHIHQRHTKCDSCGKSFEGKNGPKQLKVHLKMVHEGQKNHTCEACGKSFYHKTDMKRHIDSTHLKIPNVWKRKS